MSGPWGTAAGGPQARPDPGERQFHSARRRRVRNPMFPPLKGQTTRASDPETRRPQHVSIQPQETGRIRTRRRTTARPTPEVFIHCRNYGPTTPQERTQPQATPEPDAQSPSPNTHNPNTHNPGAVTPHDPLDRDTAAPPPPQSRRRAQGGPRDELKCKA